MKIFLYFIIKKIQKILYHNGLIRGGDLITKILIVCVMAICGLLLLVLPKKYLYNSQKVNTEAEIKNVVTRFRLLGVILLVGSILYYFVF